MTASALTPSRVQANTGTGLPLPLERFYFWERNQPDKICFIQPVGPTAVQEFTWAEVGRQVRGMAAYLKASGLKPGDRVGILSKNCAYWIMSDLAIWMAGGVSVPLYPTLTADSVRQILQHSESRFLFVGKLDTWDSMKAGVDPAIRCIRYPLSPPADFPAWETLVEQQTPLRENPSRTHTELATIIYTSGTTGMPKGVMHTFGNIAAGASRASDVYEVSARDRMLSYLPLSHVAERMSVEMVQLYQGTQVYFADSLDTFAQDLQRARPTIFFAVPRIWAKFQAGVFARIPERKLRWLFRMPVLSAVIKQKIRQSLGLDAAKFCLSGAAPITTELLNWYRELGIELIEVYGMTENFGYSHSTRQGRGRPGYVGQPNPAVEARLGEGGEVLVRSPTTMTGYYKDSIKTAEAIDENGYLRTGDVGVIDTDGSLRITGRIKEIFKTSKGKYVAPFPIESRLLADAHIEQCCVVGNAMPQPIALVSLSEPDRLALRDGVSREPLHAALLALFQRVNAQLDPHEKLKTLVVTRGEWNIDNGILTPTLKIKRNVLESRYEDRIESWYESSEKVQWE